MLFAWQRLPLDADLQGARRHLRALYAPKCVEWAFCEVGHARRGPGQPEVTCASRPLCLHASACLVDKARPTPCPLLSSAAFYIGPHPQPIWSILKPV